MAWSIALVNLDQLAFFRLKRLLIGKCVAVTGDLMVIVIGRCCVCGMGSSIPLWYIEAILVLTNATSGLYPLFHRALSKYFVQFCIVDERYVRGFRRCFHETSIEVNDYNIERSSASFR